MDVTMNKAVCSKEPNVFGHMMKYGMAKDRPTVRFDLQVYMHGDWGMETRLAHPVLPLASVIGVCGASWSGES